VLIDPFPLAEQPLRRLGAVAAICLTCGSHQRSAWRYRRDLGVPVYAPALAREIDEQPEKCYGDGDLLAGGLRAVFTPGAGTTREVEGVPAGAKRIATQREVKAVIKRLTRLIGLRLGRGGEREMTTTTTTTTTAPDVEASAEPRAEKPPAEEQAEERAAEEAPAEEAAEAAPAEEPAAEAPPAEEPPPEGPPAEGQTTP
jgi:hypothetical protein